MNEYGFFVVVVATVMVLCSLLERPTSTLSRVMSLRPLVAVGRRSYGIYLYHWPIFLFLGIDNRVHVLALAFGGSLVAAWLSYALLERPFLRLKDRWRGQPVAAPSLASRAMTPQTSTLS